MSWWDTGERDDVIGDQPADATGHALNEITANRAQQSQNKITLSELLRAIGAVARAESGVCLHDVPPNLGAISATLASGSTLSSGPLPPSPRPGDGSEPLSRALRAIAEVYRQRWGREPRLSEWLETILFVLRAQPEVYLHDGLEHAPAELHAE